MSFVVPAPLLSYASPFTKQHIKDTFPDPFSSGASTLIVANTEENEPSSRYGLINLKRRFKQVLGLSNKHQNMVEPSVWRPMMEPRHHLIFHPEAPVPTLSSIVCGRGMMVTMALPKGILKTKQPFGSPVVTRPKHKVRYNDAVVIHDTFAPCEYDRSRK